jgi:radical SAM superfamily enzyme YgiQ (UPF0313 family)
LWARDSDQPQGLIFPERVLEEIKKMKKEFMSTVRLDSDTNIYNSDLREAFDVQTC